MKPIRIPVTLPPPPIGRFRQLLLNIFGSPARVEPMPDGTWFAVYRDRTAIGDTPHEALRFARSKRAHHARY